MATLALAGDTMLGRAVAERLTAEPRAALISAEVAECIASADALVLNLECCISDRGERFPDPAKPFFFRAPPIAAERLAELGVNAVTLANNHALDYGPDALLDTLTYLRATGIATVGAGADLETAHTPLILRCGALRIRLVAFSDHPADYAAGPDRPGIAFAELRRDPPDWVLAAIRPGPDTHLTLATPHWGPNMVPEPQPHVRRAAGALLHAGANLVAGHSAHVFHGVAPGVIFDMGDFLDDYIVHRKLRNDLGLLWLIDLDPHGPRAIRALPLALEYCFTRRASPAETDTILRLLQARCTPFGTDPHIHGGMIELNTDRSTEPT